MFLAQQGERQFSAFAADALQRLAAGQPAPAAGPLRELLSGFSRYRALSTAQRRQLLAEAEARLQAAQSEDPFAHTLQRSPQQQVSNGVPPPPPPQQKQQGQGHMPFRQQSQQQAAQHGVSWPQPPPQRPQQAARSTSPQQQQQQQLLHQPSRAGPAASPHQPAPHSDSRIPSLSGGNGLPPAEGSRVGSSHPLQGPDTAGNGALPQAGSPASPPPGVPPEPDALEPSAERYSQMLQAGADGLAPPVAQPPDEERVLINGRLVRILLQCLF